MNNVVRVEAILFHMTPANFAALSDEKAIWLMNLDEFDGDRVELGMACEFLQEFDSEDTFFRDDREAAFVGTETAEGHLVPSLTEGLSEQDTATQISCRPVSLRLASTPISAGDGSHSSIVDIPAAGLESTVDNADPGTQKDSRPRLGRLPRFAWIARYIADPANADFRDEDILRDIRAAHPANRISRDPVLKQIRETRGARKRGPRRIREENSAE